jgi:hypothetical protein
VGVKFPNSEDYECRAADCASYMGLASDTATEEWASHGQKQYESIYLTPRSRCSSTHIVGLRNHNAHHAHCITTFNLQNNDRTVIIFRFPLFERKYRRFKIGKIVCFLEQ